MNVIKPFHAQLNIILILLINVKKITTIVGISTFISMTNELESKKSLSFSTFIFGESVIVLCFVMCYFMSILALQSS